MSECMWCHEDLCTVTYEGSEYQCPFASMPEGESESVVRVCTASDADLVDEDEEGVSTAEVDRSTGTT